MLGQLFKKNLIFLSLILVLILTSFHSVIAQENTKNEIGFYFGTKVYEERHPIDNSFFMSQEGYMLGINTNYETFENETYVGFKSRIGAGEVDYTSAGTGTMTGIPDYQLEFTGYIGLPFEGTNSRTTIFSGLGFRYLLNASGLKLSSTGHAGYDRESRYSYLPIGVNLEMGSFELRGEYLHFIYGQQKSYISQVSANYSDITNDQEEGSGIKLMAKNYFEKDFSIEFYMDYWDIADSKLDITGNFMEPRNTTSETGLRIFWSY